MKQCIKSRTFPIHNCPAALSVPYPLYAADHERMEVKQLPKKQSPPGLLPKLRDFIHTYAVLSLYSFGYLFLISLLFFIPPA